MVVEVPPFLSGDKGVVRVGVANVEEPGTRGHASEVSQGFEGTELCFFIIVHLHGPLAEAGGLELIDGCAGVVDGRFVPVGGPDMGSRVDIWSEAFFESVVLIRTDEVGFATESDIVTDTGQDVHEGGCVTREVGTIVIGADGGRELAGYKRGSRWCANWRIAVCVLERRTAFSQGIDVGSVC